MNKKLMEAIKAQRPGEPVLLSDLRRQLSMNKKAFDTAVMELAKSGEYFLTRHFHQAQSTASEKAEMIPDGEGNYYFAINSRDKGTLTLSELSGTDKKARPGRGGSREGAGRPAVKTKVKRVPLAGARIPGWLMDWLKSEGDMGNKIEKALIDKYGLTPPES